MKRGMYLVAVIALVAGCGGEGYTTLPSLKPVEEQLARPKVYNVSCNYQTTYRHLLTSIRDPQYRAFMSGRCEHEIWTDTQEATISVVREGNMGDIVSFHFAVKATGDSACTVAACTSDRSRAEVARKWIEVLNSSAR